MECSCSLKCTTEAYAGERANIQTGQQACLLITMFPWTCVMDTLHGTLQAVHLVMSLLPSPAGLCSVDTVFLPALNLLYSLVFSISFIGSSPLILFGLFFLPFSHLSHFHFSALPSSPCPLKRKKINSLP